MPVSDLSVGNVRAALETTTAQIFSTKSSSKIDNIKSQLSSFTIEEKQEVFDYLQTELVSVHEKQ